MTDGRYGSSLYGQAVYRSLDEERAALYREQQVECRANLIAAERRLAGDPVAAARVRLNWRAIELAIQDAQMPPEPDCTIEPVTAQNRDCIC